ncbi:DUF397 domain-containing protein [Micromonospora sp. NPDC048999]|uniref:DUF397 domain-containing protein n=1 Tax=Micromonospora sp. NPDC048999 TaxID=3155391 RepID=UPI003401BB45
MGEQAGAPAPYRRQRRHLRRVAGNLPDLVAGHDSKGRTGPVLTFTPDSWAAVVGVVPPMR